jgi:hypothetical protein
MNNEIINNDSVLESEIDLDLDENTTNMTRERYTNILNIEFEKIDDYIHTIWDNVMLPYLENYDSNSILDNMNTCDYDKFYKYMLDNSPAIKHLLEKYKSINLIGLPNEKTISLTHDQKIILNMQNEHLKFCKIMKKQLNNII